MLSRSVRASTGAACAALLSSIVLASGASAAWTPATPVSAAGVNAQNPEVALDAAGNATAVWESGSTPSRTIRSAFRAAGGAWGAPTELMSSSSDCRSPELAVNPSGAAVVVADCGISTTPMRGAYRPVGGTWQGSVQILTSDSGFDPRVAIDDAGNAVAVWETGISVQSSYRPVAGAWTAAGVVSPAGEAALDPDVAMTPNGRANVIWRHDLSPSDSLVTVEGVGRTLATAWGTTPSILTSPATSTTPVVLDDPQMATNGAGNRIAVWANTSNTSGPTLPYLQSGWGASVGFWGPYLSPGSASDGVRSVENPQVAIGGTGGAVAVWPGTAGSGFRVQGAATNSLSGAWSTPVTLEGGETGAAVEPSVAVSPTGDATIVWRDLDSTTHAVSHPAGGPFSSAETISTTSFGNPRVTMSSTGDAIATWSDQGSSPPRIVVAVDDVTPPVLSAIDAPSGAESGAPISLSASATDAWSEPVALAWDFGDGASATGGAVNHAYAAAGPVTVTVTATDVAGNTATAQRSFTVAGPAGSDRLGMEVVVPKQSWKKIRKARGVKLRCTLDAVGACAAEARVSRRIGRRLGLKAKALRVGAGRVEVAVANRPATLKVKLTRAARSAIGEADRSVPLQLTVEGTALGRKPVTLKRKLRIRR